MPSLPIALTIRPGVDTQSTPLQSMGQISTSNLIRFKNGLIQKLGGCSRYLAAAFSGVASCILPWASLIGTKYVAIGTSTNLQLAAAGAIVDITPAAGVGTGDWSLDKWGEDLVAAARGGTVYEWVPPVAGGNVAVAVTNAPSTVNGLVVAAPVQQLITWGAFSATLGAQDPMLVAWCDIANLTVWTAAVNNQAGTFRIPKGSVIEAILWFGLSGLLWTDLDLWSMTYASFPLVYGFNEISTNAGLIARRAVASLGSRVAWMAQNDFFVFQGGGAQVIPCSVRDFVFGGPDYPGMDRVYTNNIHADANTYFDEIKWYFPLVGSGGVCNGWVKWSPNEGQQGVWDYGMGGPNISAWSDQSVVGAPLGTDYAGHVQQFETAMDFDDVVYNSSFLSGWFYLQEGEVSVFVERIMPDFTINPGGQIQLTISFADEIPQNATDYPVRVYGPYVVTSATPYIIVRGSGRVARVLLECIAPNTFWRYGKPLARVSFDGHR